MAGGSLVNRKVENMVNLLIENHFNKRIGNRLSQCALKLAFIIISFYLLFHKRIDIKT